MGDWQPLSAVAELAGYLAPVARAAPARAEPQHQPVRAEPQAAKERSAPTPAPAPAVGADVSWKPVGASALAALASEEIAARAAPAEAKPAARAAPAAAKSLVEALPDGGGVDPTGALPLTIKGLETTGERKVERERRSAVASRAEQARHKRSMTRVVVVAAVVVVLAVGGAAAWVFTQQRKEIPAPAPVAAAPAQPVAPAAPPPVAAPPPAPAAPAVAPAAPVAPAAVAATTPPPAPAAPVAVAPPPAPAAAPPPAAEPPPHKAAKEPAPPKGKHTRVAKAEPAPRPAAPAAAPAAPSPAPAAGKKKDSLLDFDSNDAALDEALGGGGGGGSGRSVYVPPARAGAGALPAKLSESQIQEAVAGRIDSLRRCVSEQKSRDPGAAGVLKLRWVIAADGSVREVKSLPGDYAAGPFSTCISGVVKSIKFPKSATAGQEVTFPFSF
jgi:hypothetical protein